MTDTDPSFHEALPGHEAIAPLGADDLPWLEALGCVRPEAAPEAQWLEELNRLAVAGSIHLTPWTEPAEREEVVGAREIFLGMMSNIVSAPAVASWMEGQRSAGSFVPLSTIIEAQRLFYACGIDSVPVLRNWPTVFAHGADSMRQKLSVLEQHGLDAVGIINASRENFSWSPEKLQEQVAMLCSLGITADDIRNQPGLIGLAQQDIERRMANIGITGLRVLRLLRSEPRLLQLSPEDVAERMSQRRGAAKIPSDILEFSPAIVRQAMDLVRVRTQRLHEIGFTEQQAILHIATLPMYRLEDIESRIAELHDYGFDAFATIGEEPRIVGISSEDLADRVRNMRELGFDVRALVTARPDILTMPTAIMRQRTVHLWNAGIPDVSTAAIVHNRLLFYPQHTIDAKLAALRRNGIGLAEAVRKNANILGVPHDAVDERIQYLLSLGLDARRMVSSFPMVLGIKPATVRQKVRIVMAAAHALGADEPEMLTRGIIEGWPRIMTYSNAKLWTIIRIAGARLPEAELQKIRSTSAISTISNIVSGNLERMLAAHLEHGEDMRTLHSMYGPLLNKYRGRSRAELLQIFAQHVGDRAVRTYLRGYSLPVGHKPGDQPADNGIEK